MELNIENLKGKSAPLHMQYDGQHQEQPAYIEMNEDGIVSADFSGFVGGNACTPEVFHNRTLQWEISPFSNGDDLVAFLQSDEAQELLSRVNAGHSVEWDGNNYVGVLDDDATEASEQFAEVAENNFSVDDYESINAYGNERSEYDAGDYLVNGFDASWTGDLTLDEAVEAVEAQAEKDNAFIVDSIEDHLLEIAKEAFYSDNELLSQNHLDALVEAELIDEDEAKEYAADYIEEKPKTLSM